MLEEIHEHTGCVRACQNFSHYYSSFIINTRLCYSPNNPLSTTQHTPLVCSGLLLPYFPNSEISPDIPTSFYRQSLFRFSIGHIPEVNSYLLYSNLNPCTSEAVVNIAVKMKYFILLLSIFFHNYSTTVIRNKIDWCDNGYCDERFQICSTSLSDSKQGCISPSQLQSDFSMLLSKKHRHHVIKLHDIKQMMKYDI